MDKEEYIGILNVLVKTRPRLSKRVLKRVLDPIMEDMEIFFEFIIFTDSLIPRSGKEFQYMRGMHIRFMKDSAYKDMRYDRVVYEERKRYNEYKEKNYQEINYET